MKTRKTLILSVCALVLPTLCTTPIWSQGFGPTPVGATAARSAEVQAAIHLSGSVQAIHRALVASEVPGVVEEISVREGAVVEVGDMLIQLRNTVLLKDLAGAKAQLAEALARHQLASTALERSQNLHETGIVSRQQFDDRSAEVQAWQGRADQARALIGRLEASIAASTVRAPFSGIVVREHCQLGEWVAAGGGVVELADRDRLEVVVSVPERHFAGARVGSRA
ncbi:MAG: efflux RND transporter periplasmic adaptor subunit, partial [Thermoanaerobaculia bacterium]|nr:efflux RND transporter periplasmic adaptor subunit [Thermoanaerobaculia bacterium]